MDGAESGRAIARRDAVAGRRKIDAGFRCSVWKVPSTENERSRSASSVDDDASELVFRLGDRLATLNFFANAFRYMAFGVTITILCLIAWFLGSH